MTHLTLADLEPHAHTWRRVTTWNGVGFDECVRCFTTGPVGVVGAPLAAAFPLNVESRPAEEQRNRRCTGGPPEQASAERIGANAATVRTATGGDRPGDGSARTATAVTTASVTAGETAPSSGDEAQSVERRSPKPEVVGSTPTAPAIPRRHLSSREQVARNAEIKRRWLAGESGAAIARDLGMHRTRVCMIARGDERPPKPDQTERNAEIVRRAASGEKRASIAAAFNLDIARIDQITRAARRAATAPHAGDVVGATAGTP